MVNRFEAKAAEALIKSVVADPSLIHREELSFLKHFVTTFKVPAEGCDGHDHSTCGHGHSHGHSHGHAHEQPAPSASRFEEAEDEPEEEEEEEEEDPGRVEADEDEPAPMGDPSVEVTDEMREAAAPSKMAAMELMADGDLLGAIEHFTKVVQLAPSALAYANRASCFAKLSKPNAAIRDCNAALALNSDSAKALKTRGKAYRMLGEWELAHADLATGQRIDFDEETDEVQRFVAAKVKKIHERRQKRILKDKEWRAKQSKARAAEAASGGMGGGMGGGMPNLPPQMMQALMNDPELMAAFQSPKVMAAFADIQSNPGNMMKYMSDPEIMNLVMKMQGLMGGGGGMPGGMPGM